MSWFRRKKLPASARGGMAMPREVTYRYPDIEGYGDERMGRQLFEWAMVAPRGGLAVEVGCYKGQSLMSIAQAGHPTLGVDWGKGDPALGFGGHWDHLTANYFEQLASNVSLWSERLGLVDRVRLVEGESEDAVFVLSTRELFEEHQSYRVGFLFIDADHSYEGALKDWRAWRPLLMEGAIVVWDDTWTPTVKRAMQMAASDDIVRTIGETERMEAWTVW